MGIVLFSVFLINWPAVFLWAQGGPGGVGEENAGGVGGEIGGIKITNPLTSDNFKQLISNIADWLILIGIPVATLMFLWAGVLFATSAGDEKRIEKAKKTLIWAVIGLSIILISKGLSEIIKDLLSVKKQ